MRKLNAARRTSLAPCGSAQIARSAIRARAGGRAGGQTLAGAPAARLPLPQGGEAKAAPSRSKQPGQHLVETGGEQSARRFTQAHHRIGCRRPGEILKLAIRRVERVRLHEIVKQALP